MSSDTGPVHQRTLRTLDGRNWLCLEHTRGDGVTEIIVRGNHETAWWSCDPGTIWHITAAEVVHRAQLASEATGARGVAE